MSPDPIKIEELARRFSSVLTRTLGHSVMAKVNAANAEETDPCVCHSHDYCDANMAMDEAVTALGIESDAALTCDRNNERMVELWNAAWNRAKAARFFQV